MTDEKVTPGMEQRAKDWISNQGSGMLQGMEARADEIAASHEPASAVNELRSQARAIRSLADGGQK